MANKTYTTIKVSDWMLGEIRRSFENRRNALISDTTVSASVRAVGLVEHDKCLENIEAQYVRRETKPVF